MNYRKWLMEDLQNLERYKFSVLQMQSELETLEATMTSIRATDWDKIPGGSGTQTDKMLTAIAKKDELSANLEATSKFVRDMERLVSELPDDERRIVERMYIHREKYAVENLAGELGYETAHIYRLKNQALLHMAQMRYGKGFQT